MYLRCMKAAHDNLFNRSHYWLFIDGQDCYSCSSEHTISVNHFLLKLIKLHKLFECILKYLFNDYMETLDIYPMSEVIYTRRLNQTSWVLIDLYKIGIKFRLQFLVYGTLHAALNQSGAEKYPIELIMNSAVVPTGRRRRDLNGIVIPCGIVVSLLREFPRFDINDLLLLRCHFPNASRRLKIH